MSPLIAHRGQSLTFPENTLESIQAAILEGASNVEFDVQMTADGIPVVCHDTSLLRTAGVDVNLTKAKYKELSKYNVGEPGRFADQFKTVKMPTLKAVIYLLRTNPQVTAFVELKNESLQALGLNIFLKNILPLLEPIQDRCVVISDNLEALMVIKTKLPLAIGWILHRWDEADFEQAKRSKIDFLVINHLHYDGRRYNFSADQWKWVMYETSIPEKALALLESGVHFVETNDIGSMLKDLCEYE